MNFHIGQPNRYVVLFGALLSLWISWDRVPNVIQALCLTAEILSPVALSPKEQYIHYIRLTRRCCHKHEYKLAAICADKALETRVCLDAFEEEEFFPSTLIELEKYEQAKDLTLRLAPLQRNSPRCAPIAAFRQELMGRAYMGLHQYQSAVEEFGREIPDLVPENRTRQGLELRLFVACMCTGDNKSAKKVLNHLLESRHMFDHSFCIVDENNPIITLFEPMITLSLNDGTAAKNICDKHIQFWQKTENFDDPDAVPMLEGASQVMLNRGYIDESRGLTACAKHIKLMLGANAVF